MKVNKKTLVDRFFNPKLNVDIELFSLFHALHVAFFDPEHPTFELGAEEFYFTFQEFIAEALEEGKLEWPRLWSHIASQMKDDKDVFFDLCTDIFLGLGSLESALNLILSEKDIREIDNERFNIDNHFSSNEKNNEYEYIYINLPDFIFGNLFDCHCIIDLGEIEDILLFQIYFREKTEGLTDDKSYFKTICFEGTEEEENIFKISYDSNDDLNQSENELLEFIRNVSIKYFI